MLNRVNLSAIAATVAVAIPSIAFAETVMYTDSIALSDTNWSDMVSIPKFDPSLGDLMSVSWELDGHVEGDAKFESLDAAPATVTMNLAAEISLFRPDLTPLMVVLPLVMTTDAVTAYDGVIDFGGTSGRTYNGLSNDAADSATTTDPADLALFTGVGTIDLPCEAEGASTGSGAGNLILQFATAASASVTVTYEYFGATPTDPTSWAELKTIF